LENQGVVWRGRKISQPGEDIGRIRSDGVDTRIPGGIYHFIENESGAASGREEDDIARIFISYSHRDRAWLERLQVHLKPLERAGTLDRWDDTRIQAGDYWRDEIRRGLQAADAAILLVSADFLASDFITTEELPELIRAEKDRGLPIFAVVLKPCRMAGTALAEIQTVHPVNRPVLQMSEAEQESLWAKLVDELEGALARRTAGHMTHDNGPSAGAPACLWNVPLEQNPFFAGREDLLASLRQDMLATGRAALTGLGGIGKTQIAVEYATRYRDHYQQVFWTRAAAEPDLIAGFVEIGRLLNLSEAHDSDHGRTVAAVRRWLDGHRGWLLVFDHADRPELLRDYRPRNREGHVLATSRNPSLQSLGIPQPIAVEQMTPDEATAFLRRRTARIAGDPREDQAVEELGRELGYLPLALEQAAAYITANQTRFVDYLRGYRSRRLAVLTAAPVAGEYPESVATTWALNFREVSQSPPSAELLRFSAFLFPDAIPLELIARGAPDLGPTLAAALAGVMEDPLLLDEALEPLHRYSLVRRNVAGRTYSIHPIMQAVLLDSMPGEEQRIWVERVVRALKRTFPPPEPDHWPACDRLLPHAQVVAGLIEKWRLDFPEAGFLLLDAGDYLRRRARFAEAAQIQGQLLALRERLLGPDHSAVAEALISLAKLHRNQGRYSDAEPLMERALAIMERAHGPAHPAVARGLNTLAALHVNLGRLDAAEQVVRRGLAIFEGLPEADPVLLAKTLTNLGGILKARGDLAGAEACLRRSLQIEEAALGADNHRLTANLTQLGDLCRMLGRFDESERCLRRALQLDEEALGADHPALAWSLSGLAELHLAQERFADAEPLFRRSLAIRDKAFGGDNPLVAESLERLSDLLRRMGREGEIPGLTALSAGNGGASH